MSKTLGVAGPSLGRTEFDVIVVGGGSAGCTLAARLSQRASRTVLLLEAGPDYGPISALPWSMQRTNIAPATDPSVTDIRRYEARLTPTVSAPQYRGRLLGGTSVINGVIFTRGHPRDYERWAADGCDQWGYDSVLPYLRRLENDLDFGASDVHGAEGPMPVQRPALEDLRPVSAAFIEACQQMGFRWDPDVNGHEPGGVGLLPMNTIDGERQNVAARYVDPVRLRENLTILSGRTVSEVLIDAERAVGVRSGDLRFFGGEIILCAGALASPQLLMISGIGPADTLKRFDIRVIVANDAVGGHLTEHPSIPLPVTVDRRWVEDGGPHCEANLGYYSADLGDASEQDMRILPFLRSNHWSAVTVDRDRAGIGLLCQLGAETSRGRLTITSPHIDVPPLIDYAFLDQQDDVERLVEGVRLSEEILDRPAMRKLGARSESNVKGMSRDELEKWVRKHIMTGYHSSSTCRMGEADDPTSVVDQQFRVHGVDGLRVVDLSAMRTLVRRATNASTIMMAERAADFIDS